MAAAALGLYMREEYNFALFTGSRNDFADEVDKQGADTCLAAMPFETLEHVAIFCDTFGLERKSEYLGKLGLAYGVEPTIQLVLAVPTIARDDRDIMARVAARVMAKLTEKREAALEPLSLQVSLGNAETTFMTEVRVWREHLALLDDSESYTHGLNKLRSAVTRDPDALIGGRARPACECGAPHTVAWTCVANIQEQTTEVDRKIMCILLQRLCPACSGTGPNAGSLARLRSISTWAFAQPDLTACLMVTDMIAEHLRGEIFNDVVNACAARLVQHTDAPGVTRATLNDVLCRLRRLPRTAGVEDAVAYLEASLARPEKRACDACRMKLPENAFTKNQWRKRPRRCRTCQQAGKTAPMAMDVNDDSELAAALRAASLEARNEREMARENECAVCCDVVEPRARCVLHSTAGGVDHWVCRDCRARLRAYGHARCPVCRADVVM